MLNRLYTNKGHHGVFTLSVWRQKRCVCGKFLSIKQLKYCTDCARKKVIAKCSKYDKSHKVSRREIRALRQRIYRNADRFNIGDLV